MRSFHLVILTLLLFGVVHAVSATETYVYAGQWGTLGLWEEGEFQYAYGVDIDTAGNIYVVDMGNTRIQIFSPSGSFIRMIEGTYGSGSGQFKHPYDLAVDRSGNVYVADTGNNRIRSFPRRVLYIEMGLPIGEWILQRAIQCCRG